MASADKSRGEHLRYVKSVTDSGTVVLPGMVRQPILDIRGRVHGYELLFQESAGDGSGQDGPDSGLTILDNVVLLGFDLLTGGAPAFVRCSAEMLNADVVRVLPPAMTVLEIPADLEISPKLLKTCSLLKAAGFRLALVDVAADPRNHPLSDLATYIKVDWERFQGTIRRGSAALMAGGIHTQDAYQRARERGYRYFQGFYFCYPEPIHSGKVPANRICHIEILRQLFRDPLELHTLCPLVQRDASLVYRVLRLANSPIYAISNYVTSIETAIMILGDTAFRRIATLAIECALNSDQPQEILNMALVRARFCSDAAWLCELDSNEQYLVGMLSMLPAMLRLPMETIAAELPLRDEVRRALMGEVVYERSLLTWIEFHEGNKIAERRAIASAYGLDESELLQCYFDALVWSTSEPNLVA